MQSGEPGSSSPSNTHENASKQPNKNADLGENAPINDSEDKSARNEDVEHHEHSAINGTSGSSNNSSSHVPTLKLKIGNPPPPTPADNHRSFSLRRSERIRNQALRAEETRRIKEERAAIEEARTKARSIAAKKAAATKRRAAKLAAEQKAAEAKGIKLAPKPKQGGAGAGAGAGGASGKGAADSSASSKHAPPPKVVKRVPRHIVKLHYFNSQVPPEFRHLDLESLGTSVSLFWLRINIREFLYRFDKLCRLPARFTAGLNDPLESWTPEQFKAVIMSLLKLIANDSKPLHANVRDYISEIEVLEPSNPSIWDWLLEFIEQLDAFSPEQVPTTEEEQLDLLRRLFVLCTGTETIRITVMSDVDQLKWVEKDVQEEIKGIWAKYKETEQKLAKLKATDKELYNERLAAAHRSASNKVWRSQQQLFMKTHKYNMRTTPLLEDPHGNKYWSLQYKSPTQAAWGSWILCEMRSKPLELGEWYQKLSKNVGSVLERRDVLVTERNKERRKQRQEEKERSKASKSNGEHSGGAEGDSSVKSENDITMDVDSETKPEKENTNGAAAEPASSTAPTPAPSTAPTTINDSSAAANQTKPKRSYPRLKFTYPKKLDEPVLYVVEGKENILQLAKWLSGFTGIDKKAVSEVEAVATYLAQDD